MVKRKNRQKPIMVEPEETPTDHPESAFEQAIEDCDKDLEKIAEEVKTAPELCPKCQGELLPPKTMGKYRYCPKCKRGIHPMFFKDSK